MIEADRTFEDRQDEVLQNLQATIVAAIDGAREAFAENMAAAGYQDPPPGREYFASCVMQIAYRLQCGAAADKFQGGDPKIAWHAIKNAVDISNHYWGSNFELRGEERASIGS